MVPTESRRPPARRYATGLSADTPTAILPAPHRGSSHDPTTDS